MKITSQSELMKNQKHAVVMSPSITFDVLQTCEGGAIFLSVGTDGVLYATRELGDDNTGWTRRDLSSVISTMNGGAKITVKSFAATQNAFNGLFDIALVITVNGSDKLYFADGLSDKDEDRTLNIPWKYLAFDATVAEPSPFIIAGVYLFNVPNPEEPAIPVQSFFVDIVRDPSNPFLLLDRYFIRSASTIHWEVASTGLDLQMDSISSCLGRREGEINTGIYTFGKINDTVQLIFAPAPKFRPVPVNPARLNVSGLRASAIASSPSPTGATNLFVAADEGLYLFAPNNQRNFAEPIQIVADFTIGANSIFKQVSSMSARHMAPNAAMGRPGRTVIWMKNAQHEVFYTSCPAGSERDPAAWSLPIPFCGNVDEFAFYLDETETSDMTLFVLQADDTLTRFVQNGDSTWLTRNIHLPASSPDDFVEFDSFTTTIKSTDENDVPVPETKIYLTAEHSASVFINNSSYILSPDQQLEISTGSMGSVSVIQPVTSLAEAVGIQVALANNIRNVYSVDPLKVASDRLAKIKTGDDLSSVTIKGGDGNERPLVPPSVGKGLRDEAANSVDKLLTIKQEYVNDPTRMAKARKQAHLSRGQVFRIGQDSGSESPISVLAGDLFNFVKNTAEKLETLAIEAVGEFYSFTISIAGKIFSAILDSVQAIRGAIEAVLQKIEVFFKDLVAWLGFLFSWDDIIRTHTVLKTELKSRAQAYINYMDTLATEIDELYVEAEKRLKSPIQTSGQGQSVGSRQSEGKSSVTQANDAQSNWALDHGTKGMENAQTNVTSLTISAGDDLDELIQKLEDIVSKEINNVEDAAGKIKESVFNQYSSLTGIQIVEKVITIIADLLLTMAKDVVITLIEIVKKVAQGVLDTLDTPIKIPVLSPLYHRLVGSDLTILDLVCLVAAIPATVGYKAVTGEAPFPTAVAVDKALEACRSRSNVLTPPSSRSCSPYQTEQERRHKHHGHHGHHKQHKRYTHYTGQYNRTAVIGWDRDDTLAMLFNFASFPACFFVAYCDGQRGIADTLKIPTSAAIRWVGASANLIYQAPNYLGWQYASQWSTAVNYGVTGLQCVKGFLDAAWVGPEWEEWTKDSPVIDTCLNLLSLAAVIDGLVESDKEALDATTFVANTVSALGGMLSPVITKNQWFLAAYLGAEIAFGIFGPINGGLYWERFH